MQKKSSHPSPFRMPPEATAVEAGDPPPAHQFNDAAQQREAATLGMWVFLATEVLFFGGMFLAYTVYRVQHPDVFREASQHTLIWIGAFNTAVLLLSSFIMVLAVHAAKHGRRRAVGMFLAVTAILGTLFLTVKGFEYRHEIQEGLFPGASFSFEGAEPRHAQMFFYIYFLMTGIHALHVLIGVVLLGLFALRSRARSACPPNATAIDLL